MASRPSRAGSGGVSLVTSMALDILKVLPLELIEYVVAILDQDSPLPSTRLLHEQPSELLFRSTYPGSLKSVSQTCKVIRSLAAPRLFASLKVHVDNASDLLAFIETKGLQAPPQSVLVYVEWNRSLDIDTTDETNSLHLIPFRTMRSNVTSMVKAVNPRVVTLVGPPSIVAWMMDQRLNSADSWVFNMPYQVVRLEQGLLSPEQWYPHKDVHDSFVLSTARPWNHLIYNEGSFVPAYSTYEYHLYDPPSLHQSTQILELERHTLHLGCLTSFELVAVFPFNHIQNTCRFLRGLPNLEELTVQLAPSPESQRRGTDASASGSSACQPGDFWRELEENYQQLRTHVEYTLQKLTLYTILDYKSPGYRSMIDTVMAHPTNGWTTAGNGTWTREREPKILHISP